MFKRLDRILVSVKIPKYDAFQLENFANNPNKSDIKSFITKFETAKFHHEVKSQAFISALKQIKPKFDLVKVTDIISPIKDYDLVVTLGGDGTFLKTASFIDDETPILGLNTDSDRSFCSFCSFNPNLISIEPDEVWRKVFAGEYCFKKRTRIKVVITHPGQIKLKEPRLLEDFDALNEVFFADKDVGKTSNFRISIDDGNYIYYRSGGIIVSTGSGSSGWLKSAKNIGVQAIQDILEIADNREITKEEALKIALEFDSRHTLRSSDKELMFFIREPIMQHARDYINKEYIKRVTKLKIQSELKNGVIIVDGNIPWDIGFGDVIELSPSEKNLHCIHITTDPSECSI